MANPRIRTMRSNNSAGIGRPPLRLEKPEPPQWRLGRSLRRVEAASGTKTAGGNDALPLSAEQGKNFSPLAPPEKDSKAGKVKTRESGRGWEKYHRKSKSVASESVALKNERPDYPTAALLYLSNQTRRPAAGKTLEDSSHHNRLDARHGELYCEYHARGQAKSLVNSRFFAKIFRPG